MVWFDSDAAGASDSCYDAKCAERRSRRPGANSARAREPTPIKHTLQLGARHPTDEKRDGRNVNRYAGNINANQGGVAKFPAASGPHESTSLAGRDVPYRLLALD